jgi:lipopolysaccharide/colanic/teichoic acid biosynthesis glycosyltransferase
MGADAAQGGGRHGAGGMTRERELLLRRSYRELAGGGVGWARRRDLVAIATRRAAWRARVGLAPRLKRALDLLGALALLLVTGPVLLLVALAIKLEDRGPVFFRQVRVGKYGRHFVMFKFRSMVPNAEALKAQLLAQNEMRDGILFKIRKDPRITRVGRLIRKLSLDELPQLFNVVNGEMSLVGPRPPVPSEVALYDPAHRRRLGAVPGITCLWQVSGRNEIDFQGQVRLDVQYIERQSFGLDLAILLRTIPAVISGRGAS